MSNRIVPFVEHEFYHVYNRGNNKQVIFRNTADYERFQALLFLCNSHSPVAYRDLAAKKGGVFSHQQESPLVAIGAYCLLPNHFHILATPLVEHGISLFMKKVATAYVMYANLHHGRTGGLFEGRFKASLVDSDEYFKYLYAYIHLNPIRSKSQSPRSDLGDSGDWLSTDLLHQAAAYRFSSLPDYAADPRSEGVIINPDVFPDYFGSSTAALQDMQEWIQYDLEQTD